MIHLILASQSIGRKKLLEQLKIPFQILPSNIDEEKIVAGTPLATLQLRAKMKGEDVAKKLKYQSPPPKADQPRAENIKATTQNLKISNYRKPTTKDQQQYFILSADSGAIIDDELIGKPKNHREAVQILKKLSGKTHEFVTAVFIIKSKIKDQKSKIKLIVSDKNTTEVAGCNEVKAMTPPTVEESVKSWQFHNTSFVSFRKLTDDDIKRYLSIIDYTKYAGGYALYTGQDFITNVKGSLSNVIGLPIEKILPVLRKNKII